MVRVSGGPLPERFGIAASLDDFWIARLEVTNREYKAFVDQGGYRNPAFWREPFVDAGRTLSWQDAMQRFRDKTGLPGPATWTSGTYPAGRADYPVEGVSWYEAAAYAAFAGARLPTIHHWYRAAALGRFADILTVSNFSGKGPAAVGSSGGLGPFGTQDMAGNVKEWCWTDVGGRRTLLGGSWDGPQYAFAHYNAGHPFERGPGTGLRLAQDDTPLSPAVEGPVRLDAVVRDGRAVRPVDDAVYAVMRRQYAYDHLPLNAVVEATETTERWVRVTVAFDAAYDGERLRAFLFLPVERLAAVSDGGAVSGRRCLPAPFEPGHVARAGSPSWSTAAGLSSTLCTRAPTSAGCRTRWASTPGGNCASPGHGISVAPSTGSRPGRTSTGPGSPTGA